MGGFEKSGGQVRVGERVIVEAGALVGVQPFAFNDGEHIEAQYGVDLRDDVWIGTGSIIVSGLEASTWIGKGVKIAQLCLVGHDSAIGDGTLIANGVLMGGYVKVGMLCYIGMGARIRNRVTIGPGTFIGMGSNVVSDIPKNVVAYGNPAKVIKRRDHPFSHYLRMVRG